MNHLKKVRLKRIGVENKVNIQERIKRLKNRHARLLILHAKSETPEEKDYYVADILSVMDDVDTLQRINNAKKDHVSK